MEFKGYTNIPDWMLSLDLDVYETLILAVIYGFSQDGESTFAGSQNYLAGKAKCSRRKVAMALSHLVEMGIVKKVDKEVRGIRLCEYKVCMSFTGCERGAQGCACGAHKNIEDNIDKEREIIKENRFQKPSLDEVREYCSQRKSPVDPEEFYNWYESIGWKVGKKPMQNWHCAIVTWEKKREKEVPPRKREKTMYRKESAMEHTLRSMDQVFGSNYHEQYYGSSKTKEPDEQ